MLQKYMYFRTSQNKFKILYFFRIIWTFCDIWLKELTNTLALGILKKIEMPEMHIRKWELLS